MGKTIVSKIKILRNDKILDLGSGTGFFVNEIVKNNDFVVAVEQSNYVKLLIKNAS